MSSSRAFDPAKSLHRPRSDLPSTILLIFRLLIQQFIYLGIELGQTSPSLSRSKAALASTRRIILTIVAA
jgi:hypothetical protein